MILTDDKDNVLTSPPPIPSTASSQSLCTQVVNQPRCKGQINKSAGKKKRTLFIGEESIASSIKDFFKGTVEVEKMKMQMTT